MNKQLLSVVHPLHDVSALERAESLWCAGEYSACLALLENAPHSAERFLLAAWALYRLRRHDDALAALASGDGLFHNDELRVEADALSAVLHQIKGRSREADAFAGRAMAYSRLAQCPRASNMLALRAWQRDDHAGCLRYLRTAECSGGANDRAYAVSLRAWLSASRRQFAQQSDLLQQTLNVTLSAAQPDIGLAAETLQTLTTLCRELYLPVQSAAVESALNAFPWTSDLRRQQYNTLRHVAWTYALQGQYVVGLRQLRKAMSVAPNPVLAALSMLDASWIALCSNEKNTAEAHFNDALEQLREIDRDARTDDHIRTVLLAAEICCTFDGRKAQELLEQYRALKGDLSVSAGSKHARNLDPVEDYTTALVLSVNGDVARARKLAKQAYKEFAAMGYEWRAARCALFLYESGCGETWLDAAREQARNYPRSFIGAQLERIRVESSSETLSKLTPRQRDVVRLLAEGDTVDGVAAALKTRPSTVRVHLKHIHRALGVRNRVELLRAVKQSA